jgi:hypothetical protein
METAMGGMSGAAVAMGIVAAICVVHFRIVDPTHLSNRIMRM